MGPVDWHVMQLQECGGSQIDGLPPIHDGFEDVGCEIRQAEYACEIGSVHAIDPGQVLHWFGLTAL